MKKIFCAFIFLASCSTPQTKVPEITVEDLMPYKEVAQPNLEAFISLSHLSKNSADETEMKKFAEDYKSRNCRNGKYCRYIPQAGSKSLARRNFSWKNISEFQSLSISQNLQLLKRIKDAELVKNQDKFLTSKCPATFVAAAAQKLEDTDFATANSWAQSVLSCPTIADGENFYLRFALYNYRDKNLDVSKQFLNHALQLKNVDQTRTLYWAGVIFGDSKYHEQLVSLHPYSLHAIIIGLNSGKEIFHSLKKKPQVVMTRGDLELTMVIEKLLLYGHQETVYGLISNNFAVYKEDLASLYYVMKLADRHLRSDFTTRLVAKTATAYPSEFNVQFLELAYKKDYYDLFQQYSPKTDPYLFLSLSKQESGFNPKARSRANARGLMQLLPSTARLISRTKAKDLYNVENNIFLGTNYFGSLYDQYKSVELSLAAYNAGPMRVKQWQAQFKTSDMLLFMDLIPFQETRLYVSSIVRNNYFYVRIFEDDQKYAAQLMIKSSVLNKNPIF